MDRHEIEELRSSGKTWSEIGRIVGISGEAMRSRFRRGRTGVHFGDPIIEGVTPDSEDISPERLWDVVIEKQETFEKRRARQSNQRITIEAPCGIALLSDAHIGNAGTDYKAMRRDAKIIQETEAMWASFHGDGVDNWIVGKLNALQRGQSVDFDAEWTLFFDWMDMLKGKLLFVVAGNHDNWTYKLAGVDRVKEYLRSTTVLYDRDEIIFSLVVGGREWKVKVRHKWRGNSVFNPTHGIEVSWERGGYDFDIGIGGHTHTDNVCRPFTRHGRRMYAILTSTYKTHDSYGREIGYANPHGSGSGVMVFDADGRMQYFSDLEAGADYLTYLRSFE